MGSRGGGRHRRRGYGPTGFEEAGGYMAAKIAKLENQYNDSVTINGVEEKKGLFSGVAIFVNGYTEPTAEELKRVMMVHGGTYHHYYSRSKTTHIIANNLPDTKVKNMNTERIVSPKWITDSLSAGQLLDYTNYILYNKQSKTQPRLQFKTVASPKKSVGESPGKLKHEDLKLEETKFESCQETPSSEKSDDPLEHTRNNTLDSKDNKANSEDKTEKHAVPSPHASGTSTPQKSPIKGHAMSTANPKFLSEFYNNSRLHHISTMGAMFKAYVNELQSKGGGFPGREKLKSWLETRKTLKNEMNPNKNFPQPTNLCTKSKRVIMHIDMDCFFVSVGLRKHPELRNKPVAVTHARGNPQGQAREGMDREYELNYYKQRAEKKLKAKIQAAGSKVPQELKDEVKEEVDGDEDAKSADRYSGRKFSTMHLIDERSSLSEIASCNYEARKAGVKNGIFLGPALKLCPDLQTIPYDFEGYKEVSYKLYDIVASFTHDIEAVSCDEMFVDLTELLQSCQVSPLDFTTYLRERVQAETSCPCSAGLGPNMLVARMATRQAKPNGQHWADPEDLSLYMKDHKVTELPGVGWSTGRQLEAEGLITCGNLQRCSLSHLQTLFGPRTGQSLYNYCRGVDSRPIKSEHVRKSVSAEVNYGIRFTSHSDACKFIGELAAEVESRLVAIKMKGKCITLKLKIRAKDAPIETAKFMGHGVCDNIAKSASLNCATSSADIIERETLALLKQIKSPPQDFRGVGIQMSRLEAASAAKQPGMSIKGFLQGTKRKRAETGKSPTGTNDTSTVPTSTVSNLSKDKNAEVTLVEGAGKSLDSPIKRLLLRAKRNSSEVAGNSRFKQDIDIHSPSTSSMSEKENGEITVTKSLNKHQAVHQDVAGQSSDTGPPLPVSHAPTVSTNYSSNKAKKIDMEVLLALPEDMRDQVIAEYQQQGYIIPSLTTGRGGESSNKCSVSEAQPGTSGCLMQEQSTRNETSATIKSETLVDGAQTSSSNTGKSNNSQLRGHECHSDVATSHQNVPVPVPGVARSFGDIEDASNSNSNFSTVSENAQESPFITSFSQVDSSFLEAIPEELREELRQDLKHFKQVREAPPAPLPGIKTVGGSLVKSGNGQGRGRGGHRGGSGRRGRWSKTDPRRAEAEGLVTLTSMILGNTENFRIKKRGIPAESQKPSDSSPSKNVTEEDPKVNSTSNSPPKVSSELLQTSEQGIEDKKIKAEVVPDLCGMKDLSDVKSVIQAWVTSCASPENEDADILAGYFTSLITHHDLEKLDCLIKYLYRQILRTHNKRWESAYQVVISQVQSAMLEIHGAKLKVNLFVNS